MSDGIKRLNIRYRAQPAHRPAVVLLPARYGPGRPTPPLPLVISPHGRNVRAATNASKWSDLPARGDFAVVCPGGMGRRLPLHSWGWRGQIADLSRMPEIVRSALPWLRVDKGRIYAVGGSMGGHETLLLLGQYPKLLDGAVAFDSVTNFYLRYNDFARSPGGRAAQALARVEVGGTPRTNPRGYVLRSPTHWLPAIAQSGAAALVERGRQDRHRPGETVRSLLPGAAQAASARARRSRHRLVEPLLRELREDPASGRNGVARPRAVGAG